MTDTNSKLELSNKQIFILRFLSNRMESTAKIVGSELVREKLLDPRYYSVTSAMRAAANILGRLNKMGLVLQVKELRAWKITLEGRDVLTKINNLKETTHANF
jgi:hypothetical protein